MPDLTLRKARQIISATRAKGRELELKPLSVIVLDSGGHPVAFARATGAAPGRFEIARGKAYGAVMLHTAGTAQKKRAETEAYFLLAANGAFDGRLIPVPGGVLVRNAKGKVMGAVGVTGDTSENDALCAVTGIEAAGLVAEA